MASGFVLDVSAFNDGILFTVQSEQDVLCYYESKKVPIMVTDMVIVTGNMGSMIIMGQEKDVFICRFVNARCRIDLFIYLANYFKKYNQRDLQDLTMNFTKYGDICGKPIVNVLSTLSTDFSENREKAASEIESLAETVFPNMDEEKRVDIIKRFLSRWHTECCIRPLELLGIPRDIINTIKIPLHEAIEIAHDNPMRIAEIPYELAERIFRLYIKEEPTFEQQLCGKMTRVVYENFKERTWTSVPINVMRKIFESFDKYKDILLKDYFCSEDLDSIYLTYILRIEKIVANKISSLLKKPLQIVDNIIDPSKTLNEVQTSAILNSLQKYKDKK